MDELIFAKVAKVPLLYCNIRAYATGFAKGPVSKEAWKMRLSGAIFSNILPLTARLLSSIAGNCTVAFKMLIRLSAALLY